MDRQDLENKKLEAEIAKLDAERLAIKTTWLSQLADFFKVFVAGCVGVGGFIAAISQYQFAESTRQTAATSVEVANERIQHMENDTKERLATAQFELTGIRTDVNSLTQNLRTARTAKLSVETSTRVATELQRTIGDLTGVLVAKIKVSNRPLPGQKWRASKNFTLSPPSGVKKLRWVIVEREARGATFSIGRDVRFASDPKVVKALRDGSTSDAFIAKKVYVGGVSGTSIPFTLKVYSE